LVVNFGRSGNSTESIGTLDALDAFAPHAPRINITCNKDSTLATRKSGAPTQVIVLPDATHDAGFAMTSSFSTMLLTALALFDAPCNLPNRMIALAKQLDDLLSKFAAGPRPDRVVYVGAGPLAFAAREAALKVMELSAGRIPALWDSTLGFRHGPKAFVTDRTDITVFTSPNTPTSRYDADLTAELRTQFPQASVETIGAGGDIDIAMPFGAAWAAPLCVASAQVRGVVWSHNLGLNVDDPFSGQSTLSRVVSGVKLYPVVS
jgi:tagatose-6-phosphate ketose/aldose isomerase